MKIKTTFLTSKQTLTKLLTIACLITSYVATADNGPLQVDLQALKITKTENNKELLLTATKVAPGDEIVYIATYKNTSKETLKGISPTIPVPQGMEWNGKGTPTPTLGSLDGKKFEKTPIKHQVHNKDGSISEQTVKNEMYRALRWEVGTLSAGQATNVTLRVKVGANPTTATNPQK